MTTKSSTPAAPTEITEPVLIAQEPPPVTRDRMVHAWVAAMSLSWFGDALWAVALAWTAANTVSPAMAGVVLGSELLPQAVFVLIGGILADRYNTRRIVIVGRASQGVILVSGAIAWWAGIRGPAMLITMGILLGTAAGLALPSGATLVRQLVRTDDLTTVSGWNQIANRGARLLGAPAGGFAVAAFGPGGAMALNALTFLVVASTLAVVVHPRYVLPHVVLDSWTASLRDGMAYLRRTDAARLLVLGLMALNVFVSPVLGLGVALRVTDSGWDAAWLGIADGGFAVGAIIGSLVGIRWKIEHPVRAGFIVLVFQGLAIAMTGLDSRFTLLAATTTIGLCAGSASVWLSGAYQRTIAPSHLGRVSSVSGLGDMALVPLAIPAFGAFAAATSIFTASLTFGLAMSALCLWFASRRPLAEIR